MLLIQAHSLVEVDMNPEVVRKINLIEALEEQYPGPHALPEDAVHFWTEAQIRQHYTGTDTGRALQGDAQPPKTRLQACVTPGAGAAPSACQGSEPSSSYASTHQAGGGRAQVRLVLHLHFPCPLPSCIILLYLQGDAAAASAATPPEVRAHQIAATVAGYRRQAIADGIPYR